MLGLHFLSELNLKSYFLLGYENLLVKCVVKNSVYSNFYYIEFIICMGRHKEEHLQFVSEIGKLMILFL